MKKRAEYQNEIAKARAILGEVSAESIAARFGCSPDQARAGFIRTAQTLRAIADGIEKAIEEGKTHYSGYCATVSECARLRDSASQYEMKGRK